MFLKWQSSTECDFTTYICFCYEKGAITISNQRHTWYPEKARTSAVDNWSPFTSELKVNVVNCWKSESKLLLVGRAGDGWDKPSTPGPNKDLDSQSQQKKEEQ